jgi:hypothetical protein
VVLSEARCPTCGGNGQIIRDQRSAPCPTCSPASPPGVHHLHSGSETPNGPLEYLRWAASFVGAVAFVAMLALLVTLLWH